MNRIFLDTNILVYAFDTSAGKKYLKAQSVLRSCWEEEKGSVSTQVLQEFYVTVTRKIPKPLSKVDAREIVQTFSAWPVYGVAFEDIVAATELEVQHSLSFWDSLIVRAAKGVGASTLYSEDLQDGREIEGLKIANPFH